MWAGGEVEHRHPSSTSATSNPELFPGRYSSDSLSTLVVCVVQFNCVCVLLLFHLYVQVLLVCCLAQLCVYSIGLLLLC